MIEPVLSQETINFLQKAGEKSATYGNLIMAGDIHHAIHTLHLVRNQLDNKEDNYESRVMFLNAAIKVLDKELIKSLEAAITHWTVARQRYVSKETRREKEEALESDTKGTQETT